jgi:hypothetical protein
MGGNGSSKVRIVVSATVACGADKTLWVFASVKKANPQFAFSAVTLTCNKNEKCNPGSKGRENPTTGGRGGTLVPGPNGPGKPLGPSGPSTGGSGGGTLPAGPSGGGGGPATPGGGPGPIMCPFPLAPPWIIRVPKHTGPPLSDEALVEGNSE